MILHFFNTFDQKGEDILDFQSLFLAFSLMSSSSAEEKLRLGFKLFKTNELYQDSACELLTGLEEMLDFRSFVVRSNLKLIFPDNEQKFDFDSFSAVFFSNPLCEVLLKMMNLVESDEEVNGLDLSVSSLVERFYSNIHSPLKVSGFSSLASSFEGDFQEIDEKLPVVKKYEEVITEERFKVVFEFFEVDRPGIAIFNEFQGKVIKFVVAFGRDLVEVNEDFKSTEKEVRENLEGFTKTIDIPEKLIVQKERVGCSRLCSVQSCECF
jgi:Ca2+-binding EF-hand superfamily protein